MEAATRVDPRQLVAHAVRPETIPTREGEVEVKSTGVVIVRPLGANTWMVFGKFDLLELTRKAWGSDANLLDGLATSMRQGHRWECDDEPF